MFRACLLIAALVLASCEENEPVFGPDGRPVPQAYQISDGDRARIQFRMLDSVNVLRQARGLEPVSLSAHLNAAAKTHALDMSVQNRPWHFGSDGSSPLDRVARAGYPGQLIGENISETYETEIETLSAWMEKPEARQVILDPRARDIGFAWHQESSGKIWWTLVMGKPETGSQDGREGETATASQ
ncbi:MAG: CAP domain-containing protein [Boseongicola sp.]|nr:CAP domain-containing protein [Boseongicola sp.]